MAEVRKSLYQSGRPIAFAGDVPVYATQDFADGLQYVVELLGGANGILPASVPTQYTPTLNNTTNVAASTAYPANYVRIGNSVLVNGRADVDPTAAGQVVLGLSLPIASDFTSDQDLSGSAAAIAVAGQSAGIHADTTNNRALIEWIAVDTANRAMYFWFMYRVI